MSEKLVTSTAWCFGDNINTDVIYPGRYLVVTDPIEMGRFAMAGIDSGFGKKVRTGDIIIAGSNFGMGSSREQAAIAIKNVGIIAIFARSFARIFYRNIINQGVYAFICSDGIKIAKTGDTVEIDFGACRLINITSSKVCDFESIPNFLLEIIQAGGNIQYLKNKL